MEGPSGAQATLAHYWDDAADTLAGDQQHPITAITAPTISVLNTVLIGAATVVSVFWLSHWLNTWRRARRQKKFDLDLRRRHGIPDSDTRPFNVAYQAASIAVRDSVRNSQSVQPENSQMSPTSHTAPFAANIQEGFRQARSRLPIPQFPGQQLVHAPSGPFNFAHPQPTYSSTSALDTSRALSHHPSAAAVSSWGPRYAADNFRATSVPAVPTVSSRSAFAVAAASGSVRSNTSLVTGINSGDRRTWHSGNRPVSISRATATSQARSRKRLYLTADEEVEEDEQGVPTDKRSRTAGWGSEAMIDGDNEPTWAQSHEIVPQTVSESSVPQIGKSKGKRPADDGEGDLHADCKRRQTKQRPKSSVIQEKRGIKRERKEVDTASVLNDVIPVHKRGRAGDVDNDLSIVKEEEIDEDDPTVSRNPLCGGRRIGQKWTSNGQEFMVGPNGDRLRLVNVKESRKKYYMPADSKHADNFHTVEVFVEKWLTEEQYANAKADGLLAWQENDNLPTNIKQESPERVPLEGKENQEEEGLRTISTTAITLSRARAANTIWNTPGQSPLQPNSPHTNPFNTPLSASAPQSPGPRRVKYSIGTVPAAALNASRIRSTWEKQEREANGLKILRERMAAQAAANAPPAPAPVLASTSVPASVPTPAPVAPTLSLPLPPTVPAITVTAASPMPSLQLPSAANKPAESKPTFSFAPSAPKPVETAPAAAAPTPAAAPANLFSFAAPKKEEPAKLLFSATSAAPSTLTFPKATPSAPLATPAFGAAPSTNTSATPAVAPAPLPAPTAAAAPSPFGAPAPTAAPKPSPFAFAAPSTAPQPTAPVTNAQAPARTPFGATPAPAPFGTTPSPFGATPAAPAPAATKPTGGFSFGVPAPTPTTTSTPTPTGSALFGAPVAKPAPTGFSFNTSSTTANGTSDAKPAATGFSFSATPASTTPASTGFGNAATAKPNVFGSTATASGTTSAGFGTGFGSNNTTGTGANPSPFSFAAPKPSAPAAPTSGFGAQPAATTSNGLKFGETASAAPTAAPSTGSGFQFGAPKPTLTIPASNPFGAPATTTPTTATNGGFTFGAGAAASPATPSKPVFNLGAAASPLMGTRQISTSKRVQRAISKPPQ